MLKNASDWSLEGVSLQLALAVAATGVALVVVVAVMARSVIVLGQRLVQLQVAAVVVNVGVGLNDLDQQTAGELELQGFRIHLRQGLHHRLRALRTAPLLLSPVPAQSAPLGQQVRLDLQFQLQDLIAAALLPLLTSAQSASNHCSKIRAPSCAEPRVL